MFNFTPCVVFLIAFYLKTGHYSSLRKFAVFLSPKWRNRTSLKRHFLKGFSTDFPEILVADVKLMMRKVLKVLRRYLSSFLSYRVNPAGGRGAEFAHLSGARVKPDNQ